MGWVSLRRPARSGFFTWMGTTAATCPSWSELHSSLPWVAIAKQCGTFNFLRKNCPMQIMTTGSKPHYVVLNGLWMRVRDQKSIRKANVLVFLLWEHHFVHFVGGWNESKFWWNSPVRIAPRSYKNITTPPRTFSDQLIWLPCFFAGSSELRVALLFSSIT
jgi:hypothetical protein